MHTVFGRYALESFLKKEHLLGVQASLPASFPHVRYNAISCHLVQSFVFVQVALGVIPLCLLRTLTGRFATCLNRGASTEDLEEDVFKKLEDNRESVAIPLDNGGEPHLPMVNKQNLQTLVSKGDCA